MRARARRLAIALSLASAVVALAACGTGESPGQSLPVASVEPSIGVSAAVLQTRVELVRVLGQFNLVLSDTQTPVRPAESPLLTAAPRAVYQVVLPKDPNRGFIVVYEFTDPSRAAEAAAQQAAYLGTGPARVQTPLGTVSIVRQVGSTVVLYVWLPEAALDASAAGIQTALESIGIGFPVPN
jgi:hypothetical protein